MYIRFINLEGNLTTLDISDGLEDGIVIDVTPELGAFYQQSQKAEKSNNRKNTRTERHTSLDTFSFEDARFFSDGTDILGELIQSENVKELLSGLTGQQRRYVKLCIIDGWTYVEIADIEGKDESAVRRCVNRALDSLRKTF